MATTMLGPGRHSGKAVANRWRATGGAGHKCYDERADWPLGRSRGRAARALPQSPFSVAGCGGGRKRRLGRGVACGGGRRCEWCVPAARAGFSGGSWSGTTMNWRGRTVEYSRDVRQPSRLARLPAWAPTVRLTNADWWWRSLRTDSPRKVLAHSTAWGWPKTTPSFDSAFGMSGPRGQPAESLACGGHKKPPANDRPGLGAGGIGNVRILGLPSGARSPGGRLPPGCGDFGSTLRATGDQVAWSTVVWQAR